MNMVVQIGKRNPKNVQQIADFFNVSTDYLLGNTDIKSKNLETDLNKTLDTVKSFDGKPITDSDRETIREILKRRQREREQKENKQYAQKNHQKNKRIRHRYRI